MSIIHTKFLVHWTGNNFHEPPTTELDDSLRNEYIKRLTDILEYGFYMCLGAERIYDLDGEWIQQIVSRLCFTEIKLSGARKHTEKYGNLGIGVDRDFVIERYGNPVFYMMNGKYSNVTVNARKVLEFIKNSNREDILLEYGTLMAYFKNMNDRDSNELIYYDELEWRITHLNRLEKEGYLIVQDRANHVYRVKLNKKDVKVIVFPDETTKEIAFNNSLFLKLIDKPISLTIADCEHF